MTGVGVVPFFDELGIVNVVWIDDLFDPKEVPTEADVADIMGATLAAGQTPTHPKLADLTNEDTPQVWVRMVQDRLTSAEVSEFVDELRKVRESGDTPEEVDYSAAELEAVIASLGSTVKRVGLSQWPTLKDELIASTSTGVFLVDRERAGAGGRQNVGDAIIQELFQRGGDEILVIVLTHSVGPDGTEQLKNEMATDLDVPASKLRVISKRSRDTSLAIAVRASVRVALTEVTCAIVTERIRNVMQQSLMETAQTIISLPVEAIDRAVFQNSLDEGASELDVLSRILASRQRTAVDAHVAWSLDDITSPLSRMRRLRQIEQMPPQLQGDTTVLQQWRRDEVFDLGPRLNELRSPLACGDIFVKDGTNRHYILLGQPCDLMVRGNGNRNSKEATFVRLISAFAPNPNTEGHRFFEVPPVQGTERWALDFREWVSVNLECLEWASFNVNGKVELVSSPTPPKGLLPGWERRFERARSKFQKGRQYCLSLGEIPNKVASASDDTVKFPYQRVARLRGTRAAAAYAAFATFHARGAFEHDYSKGLGAAAAPPATSQGDVAPSGEG